MSTPMPGRRARRAGWALAGPGLVLAGLVGMAPAPPGDVITRLGPITVSSTALRPGPGGTLTASMQVSTSGPSSDQLDAAIAAGGAPVAVYHQQVDVGEVPDLTDCGGVTPPVSTVSQWLHYGPLPVPGEASPAADAIVTVRPVTSAPAGRTVAIILYFAQAGSVTLRLPVVRS